MIDPRLNFQLDCHPDIYIQKRNDHSEEGRFVRRIVQFLPRRGIKEGRNERKTSGEKAGSQYLGPPPSFKCVMIVSFLFFPKYFLSISRIVETRLDFRVVTLRKKKEKRKERENKRGRRIEEEMEGSEGERRRKQRGGEERVAHNGANEKEEGGKGEEAKEK